jgi:hypothetical protein
MSDRGVSNVTDETELFKNDRAAQWLNRPQPAKPMRQAERAHRISLGEGDYDCLPAMVDECHWWLRAAAGKAANDWVYGLDDAFCTKPVWIEGRSLGGAATL